VKEENEPNEQPCRLKECDYSCESQMQNYLYYMYVIVDHDRQPVKDAGGRFLACDTAREAKRYLLPGERVIYSDDPPPGPLGDVHLRPQLQD